MKMKKNLLKMALLAFATFAASVASAQTYSGKITSSDWSGDKGLESDVDYSLTYIESTKKLNFEFTVPCDKKIINAYFFAEHGFGETKNRSTAIGRRNIYFVWNHWKRICF